MASSGLSADMTKVIFYVRAFNVYGKRIHKALLSYWSVINISIFWHIRNITLEHNLDLESRSIKVERFNLTPLNEQFLKIIYI